MVSDMGQGSCDLLRRGRAALLAVVPMSTTAAEGSACAQRNESHRAACNLPMVAALDRKPSGLNGASRHCDSARLVVSCTTAGGPGIELWHQRAVASAWVTFEQPEEGM